MIRLATDLPQCANTATTFDKIPALSKINSPPHVDLLRGDIFAQPICRMQALRLPALDLI